jgi:hypothetical protein
MALALSDIDLRNQRRILQGVRARQGETVSRTRVLYVR